MNDQDERIGRTLPVVALHAGHTVTVVGPDKDRPLAYVLRCECGTESILGGYWLDRCLARGTLGHGAISQPGELDALEVVSLAPVSDERREELRRHVREADE